MGKRAFFVLCACSVFITANVFGEMITETQYFGGIPNLNGILTFKQFDKSADKLQSIALMICLQTTGGRLILDNDSSSPVSGLFQFGAYGSIISSDVILLNSSYMPSLQPAMAICNESFSLAADNGDGLAGFDASGPDGMSYAGDVEMDVKSGLVDQTFWSMGRKGFLGTGTFNLNYSIMQWIDFGNKNLLSYGVNPLRADGFVTVIYTYDAAPEPSTIILFSISLALFRIRTKS